MTQAPETLSFACDCKAVTGAIAIGQPIDGEIVVCHCNDCRDFVRLCGKADTVLDELGGLSLFNFRGSQLSFDSGIEHMASLHMTDKPVLRWEASCCHTPMFNSYATTKIPFLDICLHTVDDPTPLAELETGARHLFIQSATGDASKERKTSMLALMVRTTPRLMREIVGGARKRNPLFEATTGQPIATPRRVTPAERAALA